MWTTGGRGLRGDAVRDRPGGVGAVQQVLADRRRDRPQRARCPKDKRQMGTRASDTAELVLNDIRVPEESLGPAARVFLSRCGFSTRPAPQSRHGWSASRVAHPTVRSSAPGERAQPDHPIGEFRAIRHKLADMYTRIEAARPLTYNTVWAVDNNDDNTSPIELDGRGYPAQPWTSPAGPSRAAAGRGSSTTSTSSGSTAAPNSPGSTRRESGKHHRPQTPGGGTQSSSRQLLLTRPHPSRPCCVS